MTLKIELTDEDFEKAFEPDYGRGYWAKIKAKAHFCAVDRLIGEKLAEVGRLNSLTAQTVDPGTWLEQQAQITVLFRELDQLDDIYGDEMP